MRVTGVSHATPTQDLFDAPWNHAPRSDGACRSPMNTRRGPEVVVFDVGEVLIDETRVWETWAHLLAVTPLTFAAVLGAAIARGDDHRAVFRSLAPDVDWRTLEPEHERRYGGFGASDLYADVRPALRRLRDLGLRVAIAGNQPQRRRAQLERLDLPVDHIATSDDLGADKPSPAFFARVCDLVGADEPARVCYVGDRIDNDVVPAMKAGMFACWLRRGPWGHLQAPDPETSPDLTLSGLDDLCAAFAQRDRDTAGT
jgi:HAD superfamily hydrolase (TIGR01549 family)